MPQRAFASSVESKISPGNTNVLSSSYATEHIHKNRDIDEASFQANVGYILSNSSRAVRPCPSFDFVYSFLDV